MRLVLYLTHLSMQRIDDDATTIDRGGESSRSETFGSAFNLAALVFIYLTFVLFFCYFVALFVGRWFNSRLINVCGYGLDSGDLRGSLRYNAWIYRDEDPESEHRGKVRLGDSVADYALSRYGDGVDCGEQCWHVFQRTALGRPLALRFDSRTRVVSRAVELDYGALDGLRLRDDARLVDNWRDSQYIEATKDDDRLDAEQARLSLASLAFRYDYTVSWRRANDDGDQSRSTLADFPAYLLVFTIRDRRLLSSSKTAAADHASFEFAVSGFRPSVALSNDNGTIAVGRLPAVSLIARDSRYDERILAARSVSNDNSTTGSNVNSFTYESSPCYDPRLGQQTAVPRPIGNLRFFEQIYLRSVAGSYPADQRDKLARLLDRFYVDCLYDSSDVQLSLVDEQLRPSVFAVAAYLRVCPPDRPVFDARKLVCVPSFSSSGGAIR